MKEKPSISDAQDLALKQYCALMGEIKRRFTAIENALNGHTGLRDFLVQEFCFLQLRMMCELIAIACLVAHGDISGTGKAKKEWSAAKIIEALEALNPNFFPWPVESHRDEKKGIIRMTDRKGDDFLTKDDLIKLNGLCGNYLHRGTFSGIFERKLFRRVPFDEIANHAQRIVNLLGHHTMHLSRKRTTVFYCWLFGPNGRVGTAIASEQE